MEILNVEQGSWEWLQARLGIPTASSFGKIFTASFTKSAQADAYMGQLLAEYITGQMDEPFVSKWTERGHDLEPSARKLYSALSGDEVEEVGMVYHSEKRDRSCSPDGLIRRVRGLEIKCPKLSNHIGYVLSGELPKKYAPQVHGSMYVSDIDKWSFMSYHPEYQELLITVERDEKIDAKISKIMDEFCDKLAEQKERIDARNKF